MQRALKTVEPLTLLLVLGVLLGSAYFHLQQAMLLSVSAVVLSTVPFFLRYEMQKPRPRDIMPVVVLAAVAAVGRILFAPLPNFKPVSAVVIVCGLCFGRQSGFLCGALAALGSNMFFGQGMWLPWQMYAWGMIGYGAGVLQAGGRAQHKWAVLLYGVVASFLYGILLDSWHVVSFVGEVSAASALAVYAAGLPFNLSHAASTFVFLLLILTPWSKKLERLKQKYGM